MSGFPLVFRVDDAEALARVAADEVAEAVAARSVPTVVIATGATPLRTFAELRRRVDSGELDLSRLRVVQLDEYVGLGPGDRRSLWGWLSRELLEPAGVDRSAAIRFELDRLAPDEACLDVERRLDAAGGVDLAVLGLGPNGHVGFNEPPSAADSPSRCVQLDEQSIEANARYWGSTDDVPREAVTLGMRTLLAARRILLLASGAHKRGILSQVLAGESSADVPASLLRTAGERLLVVADAAALPSPPVPRGPRR